MASSLKASDPAGSLSRGLTVHHSKIATLLSTVFFLISRFDCGKRRLDQLHPNGSRMLEFGLHGGFGE
jgi:hypothetical protein